MKAALSLLCLAASALAAAPALAPRWGNPGGGGDWDTTVVTYVTTTVCPITETTTGKGT